MIHLASVVLAAADLPETRALYQSFLENRYTGGFFHDGADALKEIHRERPDVVVLGPGLSGKDADAVLKDLRQDPAMHGMPVFMLTDRPVAEVGEAWLDAGADDAVQCTADPREVLARLRPLVRVATMREEFACRAAVNADLALPSRAALGAVADDPPVLLVAGAATAPDMVRAALGSATIVKAPDLIEAQRMMEERRFDAVLLWPEDHTEAYLDLCVHIRRNPRLFNLPVILGCGGGALEYPGVAFDKGASHVFTATPSPAELRFALRALVRRQRVRWAIREALGTTLNSDVADDVVPEVYAESYLARYLSRRLERAQAQRRHLSLVGFAFAGVEAVRRDFGEESKNNLLDQLGQWLTLLVRAEDLVARGAGDRFWVVLPDTPLAEAEVVMQRIAGVVSNTDLAVRDVYRVVNVWPVVAATALTGSDTARTLMERVSVQLGNCDS